MPNIDNNDTVEISREKPSDTQLSEEQSRTAEKLKHEDFIGKELIGSYLGRYRIDSVIGMGAMGAVFLGTERFLNRKVAIKLVSPHRLNDAKTKLNFKKEARTLAMLNHPNITSIYMFDEIGEISYFVLEFIKGKSLADEIKERKRIPMQESVRIIKEICEALSHAHKLGIIHRDIKPKNVLLDLAKTVKVTDFGMAIERKHLSAEETTGIITGTPNYMSPEQVRGQSILPASDIYSLGILFFEMLTGKLPHQGKDVKDILQKHLKNDIPDITKILPNIPVKINTIIQKMTAKKIEDRYSSISDVANDLAVFLESKPVNIQSEEKKFELEKETFISDYDGYEIRQLKVIGYLDMNKVDAVKNQLKAFLHEGSYRIILDFEELTYICSSGMSIFLEFIDDIRESGGEMIFINLAKRVFRVFSMLGLNHIYNFQSTLDSALKEFAKLGPTSDKKESVHIFPFGYKCSECRKNIRIKGPGKFACPSCNLEFSVGIDGRIKLPFLAAEKGLYLKIPCMLTYLPAVRGALKGVLLEMDFDEDQEYQIIQAVDESCSNIIEYGSEDSEKQHFILIIQPEKNCLVIDIIDYGKQFDQSDDTRIDINKRIGQRKSGGFGLALIKRCMDVVEHKRTPDNRGNILRIKKFNKDRKLNNA